MKDIKTQDCWLPVKVEDATNDIVNVGEDENGMSCYLQLHENMVVMTKEEFDDVIKKAQTDRGPSFDEFDDNIRQVS